jgi:hypothetical protein
MLGLLPKGTLTVLIALVLVFVAIQYVPVYFDAWQFYDAVRQEVKFAATSQRSVDSVRDSILALASEREIPLDARHLMVDTQGPFFIVEIQYAVPIDLRVFQHDVEFDWRLTGETFQ